MTSSWPQTIKVTVSPRTALQSSLTTVVVHSPNLPAIFGCGHHKHPTPTQRAYVDVICAPCVTGSSTSTSHVSRSSTSHDENHSLAVSTQIVVSNSNLDSNSNILTLIFKLLIALHNSATKHPSIHFKIVLLWNMLNNVLKNVFKMSSKNILKNSAHPSSTPLPALTQRPVDWARQKEYAKLN